MTTRYNLGDFNIANPVYAGATVSFYTVSGGAKTTTLATLYAASTGTTQGSNPATLDSDGKLAAPLYVEVPVIATISGLGSVDDHDTGIMGLAEGAASTSATAAAASQVAAAASAAAAAVSAAAAAAAVSGVGQRTAATVGGTVDAITATFSPVFASLAASAGIVLAIPLAGANATTTPTLAIDGLTAKTIVKGSNTALAAGDIPGGDFVGLFVYDQSLDKFQLINPFFSAELKAGIQAQAYTAYTTGGTSTAYTLTPTPALAALAENQEFDVEFHTAAGSTPTLAVSGLTAKSLKYRDSTGAKQAVTSTQIPSGWRSRVTYDGTDYVVREVPPAAQVLSTSYDSGDLTIALGGAHTLTHSLGGVPKVYNLLAKCIAVGGDAGYTQNDEIVLATNGSDAAGSNYGVSMKINSTQIVLRVGGGSGNNFTNYPHATTGAINGLDYTKWALIVRAYA